MRHTRSSLWHMGAGAALALLAAPLGAQGQSAAELAQGPGKEAARETLPDEPLEPVPIIVSGSAKDERTVIAGSRIPRESLFANDQIASNTAMHGLSPGSGMTPYSDRTIKKTIRSCKASDTRISGETACLLVSARRAIEAADWLSVRGLLVPLAREEGADPGERRAAADYLLEAAQLSGSTPARREALGLLLATRTLRPCEAAQIERNLATMAHQAGDLAAARGHLEASLALLPDQPQALANLAVFERAAGLAQAVQTMRRAIAASEASGGAVPASWRQFANQP